MFAKANFGVRDKRVIAIGKINWQKMSNKCLLINSKNDNIYLDSGVSFMKNKKGFTLVELLAVIVILAIILAIAIPSVTNIISNGKTNANAIQSNLIIDAAKKYPSVVTNFSLAPGNSVTLKVSDLKNANLLSSDIKNFTTGTILADTTDIVTINCDSNNQYTYTYIDPNAPVLNPPGAPTNLNITTVGTSVTLQWTAPTDNGGSSITGYRIEKNHDSMGWTVVVANTGNTNTQASDTITAGITYYRIYAINAVGMSSALTSTNYAYNGCFIADTNVTMADGSFKKIVDVKIGDKVLSYDNNRIIASTVTATFTYENMAEDNHYLRITTDKKIINGVTANHLMFAVDNGEIVAKQAGQLQLGDILLTDSNEQTIITSIEKVYQKTLVYNLTVENYHKYFADGILVSNVSQ